MYIKRIIGIVSIFLVPGCTHKKVQQPVSSKSLTPKQTSFDEIDVQRQEAALLDIAIPPYQNRLPVFCEDQYTGQVVLGYHSDCAPEDHRRFFHEQMERFGWILRREFRGSELLLEFEKPTRSCAVSLRPRTSFFGKSHGTDIVMYIEDNSVIY
jgi:hypothetical protein